MEMQANLNSKLCIGRKNERNERTTHDWWKSWMEKEAVEERQRKRRRRSRGGASMMQRPREDERKGIAVEEVPIHNGRRKCGNIGKSLRAVYVKNHGNGRKLRTETEDVGFGPRSPPL